MVSSQKDLKLLCNPSCDSQNLFRLGAAINFDRCAILASLHLPPAALGDEARHARASDKFCLTKKKQSPKR